MCVYDEAVVFVSCAIALLSIVLAFSIFFNFFFYLFVFRLIAFRVKLIAGATRAKKHVILLNAYFQKFWMYTYVHVCIFFLAFLLSAVFKLVFHFHIYVCTYVCILCEFKIFFTFSHKYVHTYICICIWRCKNVCSILFTPSVRVISGFRVYPDCYLKNTTAGSSRKWADIMNILTILLKQKFT